MNLAGDIGEQLQDAVRTAFSTRSPLAIHGGQTKTFYGRPVDGMPLDVSNHRGIVHYEPTELVITARAGTTLTDIEAALAEQGQMLPFEPPHFGPDATLGGCVAAGLSGPRRAAAGAVRDHVLGVEIINGKAERLSFGGEVMKNVAGYDVSRLMAGALGTLGILLRVSLKVLPRPEHEVTLRHYNKGAARAIMNMNRWAARPLPISATGHLGDSLYLRLSGSGQGVESARKTIGGEQVDDPDLWTSLREQRLEYFEDEQPLWRIALPPTAPIPDLQGEWLLEWNGALRWLKTELPASEIRHAAEGAGGHATLFRGGERDGEVFHPLRRNLMHIHKNIKQAFDPELLLNPGRIYAGL